MGKGPSGDTPQQRVNRVVHDLKIGQSNILQNPTFLEEAEKCKLNKMSQSDGFFGRRREM